MRANRYFSSPIPANFMKTNFCFYDCRYFDAAAIYLINPNKIFLPRDIATSGSLQGSSLDCLFRKHLLQNIENFSLG